MLDRNYIFIFSWTIITKVNGLHNTISSVLTISLLAALPCPLVNLYLVDKPIQKMLELRFSTLFYFHFLDFRIFNQLIVNYHRDSLNTSVV